MIQRYYSIIFSNIDMLTPTKIHLAYLLQWGYTHADLKTVLREEKIALSDLWEATKKWENPLELSEARMKTLGVKMPKVDEEKIVKYLEEKSIDIISIHDPLYPKRLVSIGHAPAFFYVRGTLREALPLLIGVVGSRKHTPYAKRILEKILPDVILAGVWVVSGGALGVDTMGHDIALAHAGYTIAVFGTGIDRCYPAENRALFEAILEHGWALISHFPLGTAPDQYNFPVRNEIVAWLASWVIIPEAGLSSGTIITAQLALEHGRDVFAVPWDIDRTTSEGTNMLIASGQAKCVRCSADILEEYFDVAAMAAGMTPVVKVPPLFTDDRERLLYEAIDKWVDRVDALASEVDMEMTDLLIALSMLEISGHVRMDEMGRYQIQ
jgi:DNA processing protein